MRYFNSLTTSDIDNLQKQLRDSTNHQEPFLRFNKFSYKRIRKITSLKKNDMAFEFFKQELEHLKLLENNGEIALFFYDEMGFSLNPCVSYGW